MQGGVGRPDAVVNEREDRDTARCESLIDGHPKIVSAAVEQPIGPLP